MNILKLLFLPDIFYKYYTRFSDIQDLFIIKVNLSIIINILQEYSNIRLILDTDNNYIDVNTNSNISDLHIPNGYYYILRPTFQYCNNILRRIIRIKEDNIVKYLYHDLLIIKLLKMSYFIDSFNNLTIKENICNSKLFAKQIIDDYFDQLNLEFIAFGFENPNMTYQERINIFNNTNYHQLIERLKIMYPLTDLSANSLLISK